jgi:hypothetical protein
LVTSSVLIPIGAGSPRRHRRVPLRLEQGGELRTICRFIGIEEDRLADLGDGAVAVSLRLECRTEGLMRPGMLRPGSDRRTQDGNDSVLVAPIFQDGDKIGQGTRVAGFDPEGVTIGGDGSVLIAPDGEQVTEDVMLSGVVGPAADHLTGHGDGLVERLQPLFAPP